MLIFKKAAELSAYLSLQANSGANIGFVPTMGALHAGHLSLIRRSREENKVTVCSIFVNPTQFNNPEDFKHYPITIDQDINWLMKEKCDILFLPPVPEIYPAGYQAPLYQLGSLEKVLEGAHRPGHFQGVCQVMDRLLTIVNPHQLYMGQKDFQQCMVVRSLIDQTGRSLNFHIMPTLREVDGVAMSSRNLRLDPEQRIKARALYRELFWITAHIEAASFRELEAISTSRLEADGFQVDYVSIAKSKTLEPATNSSDEPVALIAATIGNVRLIDNMVMKQQVSHA